MPDDILLSIRNVSKRFGGTLALKDVSIEVARGEVHAIMGENGAGKSTLVKIVSGAIPKDSGSIIYRGAELKARNPREARAAGISIVYQELSLSPFLTVGENISAAAASMDNLHLMRTNGFDEEVVNLLAHNHIDPRAVVRSLGVGAQQIVEIAGALSSHSNLLILDEPTSSLTFQEVEELFRIIRLLQQKGVTTIYISHKIAEVFAIADRLSVLKDGEFMGTLERRETTDDRVIKLMLGRDIRDMYPTRTGQERQCVLEAQGLCGQGFQDASFKLYRGEVLGFAGLTGAGRTELFTSIFGATPITAGRILVEGRPVEIRSPNDAMQQGIGYLSEDRKEVGLFLDMNVRNNTIAATLDEVSGRVFMNNQRARASAAQMIERMRTKVRSLDDMVYSLSGGNQQKVLLARWLMVHPKVLVVDEPTRGIDVGAKQEVYQLLRELAHEGIGVVMISSELPEILGMCDRIVTMYQGRITAVLEGEDRVEDMVAPAIVGFEGRPVSVGKVIGQ